MYSGPYLNNVLNIFLQATSLNVNSTYLNVTSASENVVSEIYLNII